MALADVLGKETSDRHRPGAKPAHKNKSAQFMQDFFMAPAVKQQLKETGLFTAQHARAVVHCGEWEKPRLLYSMRKLSSKQQLMVSIAVSEGDYTCGSPLLSPDHSLTSTVSVRLALSCGDPVEVAFYSQEFTRKDVCAHCGGVEGHGSQELSAKFKTVLPCCDSCLQGGKTFITACPYGHNAGQECQRLL